MNKVLKWILIIAAIAILIITIGLALNVYSNYKASKWSEGFISSDEEFCSETLCKESGADYGILNSSSNLCNCYKDNQIISSKMMDSSS